MITSNKFDQNSLYFMDKKAISKEKFNYLFQKYKEYSTYLQTFVNKVYKELSDELEIVPENDYRTCITENIEGNEKRYKGRHVIFLANVVKFNKKDTGIGLHDPKMISRISDLFEEFVKACNCIAYINHEENPNFMSGFEHGSNDFHMFVYIDDENNRYELGVGCTAVDGGFYARLV